MKYLDALFVAAQTLKDTTGVLGALVVVTLNIIFFGVAAFTMWNFIK